MSWNEMPLGRQISYPEHYDPDQLHGVERQENRERIGLTEGWPWQGEDVWNAWELSWLRPDGVPRVAIARLSIPASSPRLVESKSLKLYLNSFNGTVFSSHEEVVQTMERDIAGVVGAPVGVELQSVDEREQCEARPFTDAVLIDDEEFTGQADSGLQLAGVADSVSETLCSHLLRSCCPVTAQPDWASVLIRYRGNAIDRGSLLSYLVGFRNHQDFHEHCVERIFCDIMEACRPQSLTVGGWYTRRGGIDINPWRSTEAGPAPAVRLRRQ